MSNNKIKSFVAKQNNRHQEKQLNKIKKLYLTIERNVELICEGILDLTEPVFCVTYCSLFLVILQLNTNTIT